MPEEAPRSLLTRDFAALLVTQAAFGYSSSAFQMLPKFLDRELGADAGTIGGIMATFGFASVIVTPAMGRVVDRFGRRAALAAGALILSATSVAFAAVESVGPLLYLLRALQGAAFAIAFVGGSTLAVDLSPPDRLAQALGLFGLTMLGMNAVGPVVTEEIAARSGWAVAFAAAGVGSVVCALLCLGLRENRATPDPEAGTTGMLQMLRRPHERRLAFVILLVAAACGTMFAFHQPFALSLGIERVGTFFAAYAITAAVVRLAVGSGIDRLGRHRVAVVCLALYVVDVAAMAELERFGLVPLGALFGVAHGLFFPACNALAIERTPASERGRAMSLVIASFNLGFALGPLCLGPVADAAGYPTAFLVAAGLAFLALLLLFARPQPGAVGAGPGEAGPGEARRG